MFDIDIIIPCYGKSKLISKGIAVLASQWKSKLIHITLVDDCSPNTDCHYQDLIEKYQDDIDIRVIVMPENSGQGLTRQYGIDHTDREWFMFMDEDDMYASGVAISQFIQAAYLHNANVNQDGTIPLDEKGKPVRHDGPNLALISAPLFEFDDQHTHVIPAENEIWLNSKLYNRNFIKKHNIRFNKAQSRHAEDYYFMSCFFYALHHDPEYIAGYMPNDGLFYLWYPNPESQSRVDPHYPFMLSGYTMDGSVNILKYIRECKSIEKTEGLEKEFNNRLLNMTVYSYYTFLSFLEHIRGTDYIPKLTMDWELLRDACDTLRKMTAERWAEYKYEQKIDELYKVRNHSDVHKPEHIDIEFDDYILNGMDAFSWDLDKLLTTKEQTDEPSNSN